MVFLVLPYYFWALRRKNKATSQHLGVLKAKLAKLRRELVAPPKGGSGPAGEGFEVSKTGDARVGLVGFPSVGTLLSVRLSLLTHVALALPKLCSKQEPGCTDDLLPCITSAHTSPWSHAGKSTLLSLLTGTISEAAGTNQITCEIKCVIAATLTLEYSNLPSCLSQCPCHSL
jgi:ribosome-interacting GTPase 1